MMSERKQLAIAAACLCAVVLVAVIAMQRAPLPMHAVPLEALPVSTRVDPSAPTPEECEAGGGTIQFDRGQDCHSQPSVRDVCAWGVPCIGAGNDGYVCTEVRSPYCACEDDASCPDGFRCDTTYSTSRCVRKNVNVPKPAPPVR